MSQGGRWEETSHLIKLDRFGGREGKRREKKKKEKKRKKKESGVRSSTLSLRSTEIRSSVFVGARDKVHRRDKSFA